MSRNATGYRRAAKGTTPFGNRLERTRILKKKLEGSLSTLLGYFSLSVFVCMLWDSYLCVLGCACMCM